MVTLTELSPDPNVGRVSTSAAAKIAARCTAKCAPNGRRRVVRTAHADARPATHLTRLQAAGIISPAGSGQVRVVPRCRQRGGPLGLASDMRYGCDSQRSLPTGTVSSHRHARLWGPYDGRPPRTVLGSSMTLRGRPPIATSWYRTGLWSTASSTSRKNRIPPALEAPAIEAEHELVK